jgi:hypothetical protein
MSAAKMRAFPSTFNVHIFEASLSDFPCPLINTNYLNAFFKAIKGDSLFHFVIFTNHPHSSLSKSPSNSPILFSPFLSFFPFDQRELVGCSEEQQI